MYILKSCTRQQLNTICTIDVQNHTTASYTNKAADNAQVRTTLDTRKTAHDRHGDQTTLDTETGVNISYNTLQSRITKIKKIHNIQIIAITIQTIQIQHNNLFKYFK